MAEAEHSARRTVGVPLLQPAGCHHHSWCASGSSSPLSFPVPVVVLGPWLKPTPSFPPTTKPLPYLQRTVPTPLFTGPGSPSSPSGPGPAPHPFWAPASSSSVRKRLLSRPLPC